MKFGRRQTTRNLWTICKFLNRNHCDFFNEAGQLPRIFGSKKNMEIYFSQLFRNFAAFDNK